MTKFRKVLRLAVLVVLAQAAAMAARADNELTAPYVVQAGDELEVSVWKEEDLQREVLVRPDGKFSFPLIGDIDATGKTVEQLRQEITKDLARFVPDLTVTVTLKGVQGNRIFVIGQVNHPGAFVVNPRVDVMQALSLAGGTTAFAALSDINILRRGPDGRQQTLRFDYKAVEKGKDLEQNIVLRSGDIVVVP